MLTRLLYIITLCTPLALQAQQQVLQRIILIGDAGEMDAAQKKVIDEAAAKIIGGKTTVLYLGDNIYPAGMALPGKDDVAAKAVLQSQYLPMRAKGAAVYFIPGNHDWDRSGPDGLQKIKLQWKFLNEQQDSLLKMVPENGCPDPYEINISESLTVIAFDSEWWLYPFTKNNPGAECDCKTKDDITLSLDELIFKNRYKIILLADHHPFQSYGRHGGYFSWKDHLFPLTAASKNLYLPLPVAGSLYPLLRSTFASPQDLHHPLYKDMIRKIDAAADSLPNVIHVSGHEHSLQLIKSNQLQVVSGSGAKESYVRKGHNALYASIANGFVTADLLPGNDLLLTYFTITDSGCTPAYTYTKKYIDVQQLESAAFTNIKGDSITVKQNATFNEHGGLHNFFFGENYRKEYAAPTTLPVIRISEIYGGLTPTKRGGGHQSHSLRLKDKDGKEYSLRSVDKYPEVLLPEALRETFAKAWVRDAMSAQHPYAALVVPVIANAVNLPHSNPIIGYVAPDDKLGIYSETFANTVCLIEEREPIGKSDNTAEMIKELDADNDNSFDSTEFLRTRLLDLFLGDWDRHEDQWRWADVEKGKQKRYIAVPRDRDQVFHKTEGLFPSFAARPWVAPFLHNFDGDIKKINAFFFESRNLNSRFLNQFSYEEWMSITNSFTQLLTDSLLEAALQKLPASSYNIRHDELLSKWKKRRENLAPAMSRYYYFLNKIADIKLSDKNELVEIADAPGDGLSITVYKLSKEKNIKQLLYKRTFDASVTKQINLYISKGDDSVFINNKNSKIKLRIIGGDGDKAYNIADAKRKIQLYDKTNNAAFYGSDNRLRKHLSNDSLNTAFIPTNPYQKTAPLIAGGYNYDDGLILGLSIKHIHQGFRKRPYASVQQLSITHSVSTNAYNVKYRGEWMHALGNADIVVKAVSNAPNTQNFFGIGNETVYDKKVFSKPYFRARFNWYQFDPSVQWRGKKGTTFNIGPSLQYYNLNSNDNKGRFITFPNLIQSYDSAIVDKEKIHAGFIAAFTHDTRNNKILPGWGALVSIKLQGYAGLNNYSKSFLQLLPEVSLYKSIDAGSRVVFAERLGGVITAGKTAFYQTAAIGGHGSLQGYRQFRFAGRHTIYSNSELRIKLANFASYILPGQLGIVGFYDAGRVWAKDESSTKWHGGYGGGIYFAPAQMAVLQVVAGHSAEGWYPYISLGFRF